MYALSASASSAASPEGASSSLRLQLLMPASGLLATPLYTKRLVHVPLAEALLKPGCMAPGQVSLWVGNCGAHQLRITQGGRLSLHTPPPC